MPENRDCDGVYGRSPADWRKTLDEALKRRDHETLKQVLVELRAEMRGEIGRLSQKDKPSLVTSIAEA